MANQNVAVNLDGAEFISVGGDPASVLKYQLKAADGTNIGSLSIMNTGGWNPGPGGKFPSSKLTFFTV